ncbi:MAG: 50S ribosomal protein L29 [Coriobacteriia bacterium]|nr:50S ribosomal protein L29 [Coriobacteriia bacterium]
MKPTDIKVMEDADIVQKIKDTRAELFNLRFQLATGQLDNPSRIKTVKRDIARLHTEMRARELRAAREAAAS